MREIKFRAWDIKEKKMYEESLVIGNIGFGEGSVTVTEDVEKGNELIWMQFTGLKDKNGKEIYEGDIVKAEGENYKVCWYQLAGSWDLKRLSNKGYANVGVIEWEKCKVIGNIYENPKLLEVKDGD